MELSVIIPTMNEEGGVEQVISSIQEILDDTEIDYELIVVDTLSTDRTRDIAIEKGARVIEEPQRGYGRAYKTGFQEANGNILVTMDADCTYPAEEIPRLCSMLKNEEIDFITTNRFSELEEGAMSAHHVLGNKVLTALMGLLFRVHVRDSQSGMWVFKKDILDQMDVRCDGMPFSEEIKIEAFKVGRAKEVPIKYRRRVGEAKLTSFGDGWQNAKYLVVKRFFLKRSPSAGPEPHSGIIEDRE